MARDPVEMTYFAYTDEDGLVRIVHAKTKQALYLQDAAKVAAIADSLHCSVQLIELSDEEYFAAIHIPASATDLIHLYDGYPMPDKAKREFWKIIGNEIVIVEPAVAA